MTETQLSAEQFLACLKPQVPVSLQIKRANQLDISSLSDDEQKQIANALRSFAGTKNGAMLIMGIPGPLQALLSFYGTIMPGQDRLAYLRSTPRQALLRLASYDDNRLLESYPFDKASKTDWTYYLLKATKLIEPCEKFLCRAESAGGFSDSELCEIIVRNRRILGFVPISRILPDYAVKLLLTDTASYIQENYNFKRFEKKHWFKLLESGSVTNIDDDCIPFLENKNGLGFSNAELIELADKCPLVSQWIDPDNTPFLDAYRLYTENKADELWKKYPFSSLTKDEWLVLLGNSKIDIPSAFSATVNNGMFSVPELLDLAKNNKRIYSFIHPKDIDTELAVTLLTQFPNSSLWDSYDFNRFTDSQIFTIVAKSQERNSWPLAIVAKFSDEEGSLSDKKILSLAEGLSHADGNITNVVELLSVPRIQKSGVSFFGRICKCISNVKSASAIAIRKLSLGEKPWQKLSQEFLIRLLMDVPICRKFIDWQDYELETIDKLVLANHVYEEELRVGRKFKLFVWRHRLVLIILFAITGCVALVTAKNLHDAAKERAIAERKHNIIIRINELGGISEFRKLQQLVDSVKNGEDADILQDSNVVNALNQLCNWNAKRDSLDSGLLRLESLFEANWPESCLEESKLIFAQIKTNDSVEAAESALVNKFYSAYSLRMAEIERVKRNESLAAEITKIIDGCVASSSEESLIGMLVELTQISEVECISEENKVSCSEAIALVRTKVNELFKGSITAQRKIIDKAKVVNEVTAALDVLGLIHDSSYASEENIREIDSLRDLASKKIAEIRAAEAARLAAEKEKREKLEVEAVFVKVTSLRLQLEAIVNSFDDNLYSKIREDFDSLSKYPSYDRFCKENPQEILALTSRLDTYNKGIASADELERKSIDILDKVVNRMLSSKEHELCNDLICQLNIWIEKYASILAWKTKNIESQRTKIENLLEKSDVVKILIDKINTSRDYKTLWESINVIFEKHMEFEECREIDPAKILSDKLVMSAIEDSDSFLSKRMFEFVGLIKVNPKTHGTIVPILNNSVTNATYIYCVTKVPNSEDNGLKVKKIFERTADGVIRKVNDFDYSRCQGIGLFVSTNPSFVDPDSWKPCMAHPTVPHWMASSVYGEWIPEPGYVKSSVFGSVLSEVEWKPLKKYLNGKARAGKRAGEWQVLSDCLLCKGSGESTRKSLLWRCSLCEGCGRLKKKFRCSPCHYCDYKGYQWGRPYKCTKCNGVGYGYRYEKIRCHSCSGNRYFWENVDDPKLLEELLVSIKNSLMKGGK